ncbi:hypothetical protein [Helicobacter sp. 13S00477-4]|uniref:hypothetical protein n=1 Tax=Helicobacter sp. 13S00477-4 TaxID=1905759 RepID=UPI000BA76403|nr:hypothetical protein [Helicobacter sp. 13S00477-4]PAF52295.1 hypothetical protein BKH44_03030 [Helicobacter sp. 13S00477-4]
MRVNEAIEIINGELSSQPAISSFEGVAIRISEVKRGCLFIAKNPDEIDGAIALGAYGIVYDKYVQMVDGEIAWIKVKSVYDAIIRLIRYQFLSNQIAIYFVSEIEYAIASEIIIDPKIGFFDNDLEELLSFINKDEYLEGIFIKNEALLDLVLEYNQAVLPTEQPFKVLTATLFETKIHYKLAQYDLKLPSLFLPELSSIIDLCVMNKIIFELRNFSHIAYMQPYFINAYAKLVGYGQTDRVVITESDIEKFKKYVAYIAINAKWGKLMLFLPKGYEGVFDMMAQNEVYLEKSDLNSLLKQENYNFGLVLGLENKELIDIITTPYVEPVLPLF